MKAPNISPGPWTLDPQKSHPWEVKCQTNVPGVLGDITKLSYKPNAKLVAAAPELAEALVHVLTILESPPPNKPGGVSREKIRAALKAAGYTF